MRFFDLDLLWGLEGGVLIGDFVCVTQTASNIINRQRPPDYLPPAVLFLYTLTPLLTLQRLTSRHTFTCWTNPCQLQSPTLPRRYLCRKTEALFSEFGACTLCERRSWVFRVSIRVFKPPPHTTIKPSRLAIIAVASPTKKFCAGYLSVGPDLCYRPRRGEQGRRERTGSRDLLSESTPYIPVQLPYSHCSRVSLTLLSHSHLSLLT